MCVYVWFQERKKEKERIVKRKRHIFEPDDTPDNKNAISNIIYETGLKLLKHFSW